MKKGKLGTIALILGIVFCAAAILHPLFPSVSLNLTGGSTFSFEEIIGALLKIVFIAAYLPTVIISIIAIAKNSNRKGAIIALILAHVSWLAPVIINAIK